MTKGDDMATIIRLMTWKRSRTLATLMNILDGKLVPSMNDYMMLVTSHMATWVLEPTYVVQ